MFPSGPSASAPDAACPAPAQTMDEYAVAAASLVLNTPSAPYELPEHLSQPELASPTACMQVPREPVPSAPTTPGPPQETEAVAFRLRVRSFL